MKNVTPATLEELANTKIKELEILSEIRIEFDKLKEKLEKMDVNTLISNYVETEVQKLLTKAHKKDIPLTINTSDLISLIKKSDYTIPFTPSVDYVTIVDNNYVKWMFYPLTGKYELYEERCGWEDSGCSWVESSC